MSKLVRRIGFWSAVLSTVWAGGFAIVSVVLALAFPGGEWRGIEAYVASYRPVQAVPPVLLSFLLAPTLVVLVAAIHTAVTEPRRLLSLIALAFTIVYAAVVSTNYLVQMAWVRGLILRGEGEGLGLLVLGNPRSAFWAFEVLAYGFHVLGLVFLAPLFGPAGLGRWVRWIFILNGVATGVAFLVYLLTADAWHPLVLVSLGVWAITFPIATALLAVLFRRGQALAGETQP